mgnify:CR=1 FL=1
MSGLPQVHPAGKPAHSPPDARHQSITVNHRLTVFIEQPPEFVRKLYPSAVWRMDPDERAVYLTFDDGPIPEVTPWVLDLLDKYDIKATFFMVGDNIRKHPDEFQMVVERGHRIGNHTFNHLRGFEYNFKDYLANAEKANEVMKTDLFRPPHGHMGWTQYMILKRRYKIIMWDLVTRDYSKKLRGPQVLANVMRYARNGSIITFHDSLKSWNNGNLQYALPRAIEFLKEEGYEVVLVNSNPATIMTDKDIADQVYIEPLTVPVLEQIIAKEKPDSILPTLGGQAGLNLGMELSEKGILDKYGVKLIGTTAETIFKAEDRQAFKDTMEKIGEPCAASEVVHNVQDGIKFTNTIGYPVVLRPAYTLGGSGGGIAHDETELIEILTNGLRLSRVGEVLVERCIAGWKEIEYEVMRDAVSYTHLTLPTN